MIHSMEWDVYSENLPFGQSWGRRYWLNHVRAIYNESHHLMTPSDSTQRALLELGFTSPIVTTPLGVDCTLFHPPTDEHRMSLRRGQGLEPETPVIGYLGRFGKEKSLTTLLDAFERVTREHRATLLLVGGTAEDLSISTLPDHVRVVGPTKQANLFFAMMDIFVLPSLTESFPLSILEAMATGVTPVSTPVGAVPSYLTSETNGLLFEPKDADALEDHLTALLANSDLRAQLGSAARETVAGHYSWEAATQRMIPILRPEDS
jgi:glycosyltransferase involved in cell wall biosynthesis